MKDANEPESSYLIRKSRALDYVTIYRIYSSHGTTFINLLQNHNGPFASEVRLGIVERVNRRGLVFSLILLDESATEICLSSSKHFEMTKEEFRKAYNQEHGGYFLKYPQE